MVISCLVESYNPGHPVVISCLVESYNPGHPVVIFCLVESYNRGHPMVIFCLVESYNPGHPMVISCLVESYNPGHPVVVFGLLPHEQKMSVVNMMVRPVGGTSCLLKSKERVIFHVGCRRFAASPIYSEHTNGDKYKVCEGERARVMINAPPLL